MKAIFYSRMTSAPGKLPISREFGRVEIVDGKFVTKPEKFADWLLAQPVISKIRIDPRDGDECLRNLHKVFNGAHFYCVLKS